MACLTFCTARPSVVGLGLKGPEVVAEMIWGNGESGNFNAARYRVNAAYQQLRDLIVHGRGQPGRQGGAGRAIGKVVACTGGDSAGSSMKVLLLQAAGAAANRG